MDVYEQAHALARMIQESAEYQNYTDAKIKLQQDEANATMLQEFRRRQLEVQIAQISGEDTDHNLEQLESIYQVMSLNPVVNEFLTAEYRFARMMTDVQKILGEDLDLWVDLDEVKKNMN